MVLSLLLYAQALRFAVPASALVAAAPHYFACWLSWRVLSSVLPRRAYEVVDELMYHAYQAYVTFFFEVYNGSKIIFYGDRLPTDRTENVLYICNHQSAVDWVISDMIAIRQGSLGHLRYVLKNGLRYLPLYGFYFAQHGCIYVKKEDAKNEQRIRRKLKSIAANRTPIWLVIFPEGTRYNTMKPRVIEKSQEFSRQNGLEVLDHVLVPRTKATEVSLEEIGTYIDAVYDVTIAYHDPRRALLPREEGPSLTEFLADGNQELHIHLDRIEGDSIPKTGPEIKQWLFERFARKDKLLASFLDTSKGGKFPGRPYELPLALRQTFVPTLGFVALLFVTCASREGRAIYWKWSLGCSLASVLYMGLF